MLNITESPVIILTNTLSESQNPTIGANQIIELKSNEVYFSKEFLSKTGVKNGEMINLQFYAGIIALMLLNNYLDIYKNESYLTILGQFVSLFPTAEYTVLELPEPKGMNRFYEVSSYSQDYIVLDARYYLSRVADQITTYEPYRNFLAKSNIEEICIFGLIQLKGRHEWLSYLDTTRAWRKFIQAASRTLEKLGIASQFAYSLLWQLYLAFEPVNRLLSLTIYFVLIMMLSISVFMILNIFNMITAKRLSAVAIQRTVGLSQISLVSQVLTLIFVYSILGIAVSVPLVNICIAIIKNTNQLASSGSTINVSTGTMLTAAFIGLAVPLLAAYPSIRRVLAVPISSTLRAAADRPTSVKVQVDSTKLYTSSTTTKSWTALLYSLCSSLSKPSSLVALFTLLASILVMLLVPASLHLPNSSLFAWSSMVLVLASTVGCVLLLVNFTYVFEWVLVTVFLWWESRVVRGLVTGKWSEHRDCEHSSLHGQYKRQSRRN